MPDDRINVFYVVERVKDILEIKNGNKAFEELQEFHDELVHNIGIDAIIKNKNYD